MFPPIGLLPKADFSDDPRPGLRISEIFERRDDVPDEPVRSHPGG